MQWAVKCIHAKREVKGWCWYNERRRVRAGIRTKAEGDSVTESTCLRTDDRRRLVVDGDNHGIGTISGRKGSISIFLCVTRSLWQEHRWRRCALLTCGCTVSASGIRGDLLHLWRRADFPDWTLAYPRTTSAPPDTCTPSPSAQISAAVSGSETAAWEAGKA